MGVSGVFYTTHRQLYVTENSPVPNTGGSPSNIFQQDVANQEAFNLMFQEIQTGS